MLNDRLARVGSAEEVDQQAESGRELPPPRVIDVEAWAVRRPILEHDPQVAALYIGQYQPLRHIGDGRAGPD